MRIFRLSILFVFLILTVPAFAQKLTAEEIVAKHLDSIGTKEKRDAVKNRLAAGTSQFESKLPNKKTAGKAVIVSEGNNLFFVASFNSNEYPFEKIGFFGNKINLPYVTAGTRSPLGAFINDHSKILSEGILTGSISSTWAVANPSLRKGKLDYAGKKKVDGREAYILNYFPDGTAGKFTIRLFFDAATFRHFRTEYFDEIPPASQPFGALGTQTGVKIEMNETFDDFKDTEGLTLSYSYKIKYKTDSNSGTYEYTWGITFSKYLFNQKLDANFFNFDEK